MSSGFIIVFKLTCIETGGYCNCLLKCCLQLFFHVVAKHLFTSHLTYFRYLYLPVIYKALTLHGNLTEVGRLQTFWLSLQKYFLYVSYIKLFLFVCFSFLISFKCISFLCRRDDEEMCILGHWEASELCCTICRYEACHILGFILASCDWAGSFCKWQANKSIDVFSASFFMLADKYCIK